MFRVFYYFVIEFSQFNICEIGYSHLEFFLFFVIFLKIRIGFKREFNKFLFEILFDFLFDIWVEKEHEKVQAGKIVLLKLDFFFEQKLKQVLFYLFISLFWVNYQKGKIGIFFIFTLPILQRLNIVFFVHVLTTFSQFLVVNDINVGTLHVMILHFAGIIFEASDNKLFINFFVKAKSKKCYFFLLQEIINKTMCSFPLLLINGL